MKWLLPVALAFAVTPIGTQVQAQSKFDVCSAYARDAMMAFYSSSAVPVPMVTRVREARHAGATAMLGKAQAADPGAGSLQYYFDQCMAR